MHESPGPGWVALEHEGGFVDMIGPIWTRDRDGMPFFAFRVEAKHLNARGRVHGGMLLAFFDHAMGLATRGPGVGARVTIQLNTHFMRAAVTDDLVEVTCEVVRRTTSLLFVRAVASKGEGEEPLAMADGVWKLLARG